MAAHFESAAKVSLLRKAFDIMFAFLFDLLLFQVSNRLIGHRRRTCRINLGRHNYLRYYLNEVYMQRLRANE